ncbi:type III PLP-dependent enzyme [Actinokineospora globicatena]|uniref:type III PLP-dependent enzyme n=1 Tax=Actinokineospora globicatena TaxID=103729 RepID=UPI0020A38648|nr:type III PLP-dependent enzyme [Actinokineospora globicatena]MCP2303910.1 diaminopimelate decarboxylase [Actinokineospora globicatena]GLW78930.1 diaminopimelate decarboxylase [Actinokineospora globicatena]GLW86658.1 diaminopimelate decarboxylase [Actinokineospora globicatena]
MNGFRELVSRYGSPLYVYDLDEVDAAAVALRGALPESALLYYSLKANPHVLVARALHASGCRAEISSAGELQAALAAGFAPAECLYSGPGKSSEEVAGAVAAGVRQFSVESAVDYRRVAATAQRAGVTAQCLLRVNPPTARGRGGLRMSGVASQFGLDAEQLVADSGRFAPLPGARIIGLHFFSLSNAKDADAIAAEAVANIELAARLRVEADVDLRVLDLGGGFAAPYAEPGHRVDYTGLRSRLAAALDDHLPDWRLGAPRVAFESGRYLAGGCGSLVTTVVDVKRSRDRVFAVLDTGINHLGGLAGLGRLLPVSARAITGAGGEPHGRTTLVGPLCTPADQLAREAEMPALSEGDLLVVPNTGAYGLTASLLGFLGRPVAAEVVLRGGIAVEASRLELRRVPLATTGGGA